jgi:hypothetical protein
MVSGGRADTRWCVTVTIELTGRGLFLPHSHLQCGRDDREGAD